MGLIIHPCTAVRRRAGDNVFKLSSTAVPSLYWHQEDSFPTDRSWAGGGVGFKLIQAHDIYYAPVRIYRCSSSDRRWNSGGNVRAGEWLLT